ncbi:hypothetical protein KAU11_04320, partial [Candidatus Babeliales bacterium]|nr:hypothetical protein [Candidatus Babeliales bacterium]
MQQSLSEEFWQSPPNVICFYGKTLPGFFLQKWRARVSEIIKTKFIHLACEKKRVPVELQQQSFLTEKRFYWLGEVKQQAVLQSVAGKDSGRCMVLFTEEKIASLWNKLEHVFVLEIIDSIDMYNGEAFLKLFYPKLLPAVHLFILKMVEHFHSISLDHFVSLVRYVEVAGLRNKTELTYCCDEVLEQNSSLKFIS